MEAVHTYPNPHNGRIHNNAINNPFRLLKLPVKITAVGYGPEAGSIMLSIDLGVNGSMCQGWVVDQAPIDLQNDPINGDVISTPLKLLSLESPSRHLD